VTIFGADSISGIVVEIFASDYSIILEDENVTLAFNFHNVKAAA
jgi:hypothetical protein